MSEKGTQAVQDKSLEGQLGRAMPTAPSSPPSTASRIRPPRIRTSLEHPGSSSSLVSSSHQHSSSKDNGLSHEPDSRQAAHSGWRFYRPQDANQSTGRGRAPVVANGQHGGKMRSREEEEKRGSWAGVEGEGEEERQRGSDDRATLLTEEPRRHHEGQRGGDEEEEEEEMHECEPPAGVAMEESRHPDNQQQSPATPAAARLCLEVFESRMQALEQQLTVGMQEAAAAKRHGAALEGGEDEQQQQAGRRLSSSPRSASTSTRRRRRWQSSGEAAPTEEEGPTGVLQTLLTAHVEAVLSSLQQQHHHQQPGPLLTPDQLQALRESQGRWLARQEAAILAACQSVLSVEEDDGASEGGGPLEQLLPLLPCTPQSITSFQPSSSSSSHPPPHPLLPPPHPHLHSSDSGLPLPPLPPPAGRPPSGLSSPARSVTSAASSFSRGGHLARLQDDVNGAMERTWQAFTAVVERSKDVGSASPWAEVVLLEQAQRKFRHLLAAFTESVLVVTSVRLQTEYERRRKAERSLARTRAEMALMAETIEKERGKGGAEAMLRVASLEEQMRQMEAYQVRLRKELSVAKDREIKALQAQAEAERRMAGAGRRDSGIGGGRRRQQQEEEEEGDEAFRDAPELTAQEIDHLCDQLVKAQEEVAMWRARCQHLEAMQMMPLANLRHPPPPPPPAAAPSPSRGSQPGSHNNNKDAGPSSSSSMVGPAPQAEGSATDKPPPPTPDRRKQEGQEAEKNKQTQARQRDGADEQQGEDEEQARLVQLQEAVRSAVSEERERQLKVIAGLTQDAERLDKTNRRLLLLVKRLQQQLGLPPGSRGLTPSPVPPAAAASAVPPVIRAPPSEPAPPAAAVGGEGREPSLRRASEEEEEEGGGGLVLSRARVVMAGLLVVLLGLWWAALLAMGQGGGEGASTTTPAG